MRNESKFNTVSASTQRKALIYTRISTDRQQREGDGLRSQERTCRDYAAVHGLEVVKVFSDVMSGRIAERPGMREMLAYLHKNQHLNPVVVIDDISRLSRDLVAHISLRNEIAAAGGDLQSPKATFSDDPVEQMPERMLAMIAEYDVIMNARRAIDRQKARKRNGYWCFPVPPGYKYIEDPSRGGKIVVRDEPLASIMAEALQMFASGQLASQAEMQRHLEAQPIFPKNKQGKVYKQRIKNYLTNPLYAGYLIYKPWDIAFMRAQHEPLISLEDFQRIQNRLNGRPAFPVRKDINEDFPLRGFVLCDDCGEPFRGAFSKGRGGKRYGYYVCHTKTCSSYGKSIKKAEVEEGFEQLLGALKPRPEIISIASEMFRMLWDKHRAAFEERRHAAQEALKAVQKRLEGVIARAVSATQPSLIAAYEGEIERLDRQRAVEEERLANMDSEGGLKLPDFDKAYRTAMEFLANPLNLWLSERIEHRRAAVRLTFASQLRYARNEGYRTAEIALPFRVLGDMATPGSSMVRAAGLEPARPCGRQILRLLRLPIPPRPRLVRGPILHAFAGWARAGVRALSHRRKSPPRVRPVRQTRPGSRIHPLPARRKQSRPRFAR